MVKYSEEFQGEENHGNKGIGEERDNKSCEVLW